MHIIWTWIWTVTKGTCLGALGGLYVNRRGHDRMVVGYTTWCAISTYHHQSCEFETRSRRGVFNTTLCDTVCQWLVTGRWFVPATPVSYTNKTDGHDTTWYKPYTINLYIQDWLYVHYLYYCNIYLSLSGSWHIYKQTKNIDMIKYIKTKLAEG